MRFNIFRNFLQIESASSIILFAAALFALFIANSDWYFQYTSLLTTPYLFNFGYFSGKFSLEKIINDGLMTIFFLLVSLEIKREFIQGELNSRTKAILPAIAASGGMVVPALIFLAINYNFPAYIKGWAIPTATDIAFSLGVLMLLGNRIPTSLKVFLTALAILDDLGAIIVIAIFYTQQINFIFLLLAASCLFLLAILNFSKINRFWPYVIIGFILWICILKSGIHATIAGVLLGICIPMQASKLNQQPLLQRMEHKLHPWVAYGILPLFALANAGLNFTTIDTSSVINPLTIGIIFGLFFGKQIGVFGSSYLAIKFKIARLPNLVTWRQFYGISLICGTGFTMSLFIGTLAFGSENLYSDLIKLGVILGSALAGTAGYLVLRWAK